MALFGGPGGPGGFGPGGPGGFGPGRPGGAGPGGVLDYYSDWFYGDAVATSDKYIQEREKISIVNAGTFDFNERIGNANEISRMKADISKKLYSTTAQIRRHTIICREEYAKNLIIKQYAELEKYYGSMPIRSFPPSDEKFAKQIQEQIDDELSKVKMDENGKPSFNEIISNDPQFYDRKKELKNIQKFMKAVLKHRKDKFWLKDQQRTAGIEFEKYKRALTVFEYHNANVYNMLLGTLSLNDLDIDRRPMIRGMFPDSEDEKALYRFKKGLSDTDEITKRASSTMTQIPPSSPTDMSEDMEAVSEEEFKPEEEIEELTDGEETKGTEETGEDSKEEENVEDKTDEPKEEKNSEGTGDNLKEEEKAEEKDKESKESKTEEESIDYDTGVSLDSLRSWRELIDDYMKATSDDYQIDFATDINNTNNQNKNKQEEKIQETINPPLSYEEVQRKMQLAEMLEQKEMEQMNTFNNSDSKGLNK